MNLSFYTVNSDYCDIPNAETIAAFEEGEEILNNPDSPKFSSVNALFEELDS